VDGVGTIHVNDTGNENGNGTIMVTLNQYVNVISIWHGTIVVHDGKRGNARIGIQC